MNKQLARTQESVSLDSIKLESIESKVLKKRKILKNPKLLESSYVCRDRYSKKVSTCSMNFQNMIPRESRSSSFFEKSSILLQNFRLKYSKTLSSLEFLSYSSKLGKISTARCYASSIVFNENREFPNY